MKTSIRKGLYAAGALFAAFFGLTLFLRFSIGNRIQHCRQYLLPCEGRILVPAGETATISFYILDEQEISELSEASNIKRLTFIDTNGQAHTADSWSISSGGFYQRSVYSAKKLMAELTVEEGFVIETVKIKYPDKTEQMYAGALEIMPVESGGRAAETQILSYPSYADDNPHFIEEDKEWLQSVPSMLFVSALSFGNSFTIKEIDLGVEGLGIDAGTVRFLESSVWEWGPTSGKDPANQAYLLSEAVDTLQEEKLAVRVGNSEEGECNFIIAVAHDKDYNTEPTAKYYSPLFYCVDNETGQEYLYGVYDYYCDSPQIRHDEYAKYLLEEFGQ